METIVYFSNNSIGIIQGKKKKQNLTIQNFEIIPLEEGAMFNGVITDVELVENALRGALKNNRRRLKNAKLIIDSGVILSKNIEIPKLKPKEMKALAGREFEDMAENYDDLLVDYSLIPGEKKENMLCIGLEKKVLDVYAGLFKRLKIKIKSVDVALNSIIQYVSQTKDFKGKTFALNIVDGTNMFSLLFEEGRYIFSNRYRLMAEPGTPGFRDELYSKLSALVQFHKSQQYESDFNMSLYVGIDELELLALEDMVTEMEINLFIMPQTPNISDNTQIRENFQFDDYFLPTTGFFANKKQIDLLKAYQNYGKKKDGLTKNQKAFIFPVALLALFLGVFLAFFVVSKNMENNLADMNEYIDNPENQDLFMEATNLSTQLDAINQEILKLESIDEAIRSKPVIISERLNQLASLQNGVIEWTAMSYDEEEGILHFSAYAANEREAAQYIERIDETGYFYHVQYTGYEELEMERTQTTSTTTVAGQTGTRPTSTTNTSKVAVYSFQVDAFLKAGE